MQRAVSTEPGSANDDFAAFDVNSSTRLATSSRAALTRLADAQEPLPQVAIAVAVTGLVAVGGVWRGVARRLEEYR